MASHVALVAKNPRASVGDTRDSGLILGREDPQEESMATHPIILAGESQGQRSLAGYSLWDCKQSDTIEVT